jgi:DNA-binding transcriptional LysR family regulator
MACAPDVPLQRLQSFLGLLYERHPELEPEVVYLPTAEQLERLACGELDLGVGHEVGPAGGVEAQRLFAGEELAAVVSFAHPVTSRETARLEDLAGDLLIVPPQWSEPGPYDRAVALAMSDGARFRDILEAPGPDVRDLVFAVASGRGVAVAPRSALRAVGDLGADVVARPLSPTTWMPHTCLAWPVSARRELNGFYDAARAVAQELYAPSRSGRAGGRWRRRRPCR